MQHRVPAATRRPVAVGREREAVARGDGTAVHRETEDPLSHGSREVDPIARATHHIEVVAGNGRVHDPLSGRIGPVVAGGVLEKVLELPPGDAQRHERVLVRVDPHDVAPPDCPVGQPARGVEVRRGSELGSGMPPLHLVDEVEQRRVLGAAVARRRSRDRPCRAPPRPRPARARARRRGAGRTAGTSPTVASGMRSPRTVATRHRPSGSPWSAHEPHVHDRQAHRPVLGLDEVDALDHRVAHFPVRVADDDHVRARRHVRQRRRVVLRPDSRRVVGRRLPHAAVNQHDLQVHARPVQCRERRRSRHGDRAYPHPAAELPSVPDHHPGRREAGDPDADPAALHHQGRRKQEGIPRSRHHVGTDVAVGGAAVGARQQTETEIEVVIAGCCRVVLECVERIHQGVGAAPFDAPEVARERVPLQQVARVHQDHLVGVLGAQRREDRGRARQSSRGLSVLHVVPAERPAVDVGGGDDHEVGGVGAAGGGV